MSQVDDLTVPDSPAAAPAGESGFPLEGLSRRQWLGLILAPLALAACLLVPGPLTFEMRAVAAMTAVMAILWVCESVPLAATALLPLVLLPLLGVAKPELVAAAYASDLVFLFIGGFVLANGLEHWGLPRRLALTLLSWLGASKASLLAGVMAASAFLSLWVSNTAAALVMMPVGLSVAALAPPEDKNFRTAMVLGISAAVTIGGMGTPIGSTPNLLLVSTAQQLYGMSLDFGRWMLMGIPLVLSYLAAAWLLLRVLFPSRETHLAGSRDVIREARAALGPWRTGERLVATVFVLTALAWIFREPKAIAGVQVGLNVVWPWLSDGTIAMAGALALFLVPVSLRPGRFALDWETGGKIPWEIILLFGGGVSLAVGIQQSGLDKLLVSQLAGLGGWPSWVVLSLMALISLGMSELASNTATAALMLPLAGPLASAIGQTPMFLMLPMTLATSLGFMLPTATPPNALALGTRHVSVAQLMLVGLWLNVIGLVLVVGTCYLIGFRVLGATP